MDHQLQAQFELLFSNNQLLDRVRRELDMPGVFDTCTNWGLNHSFVLDLMAQIYLHKQAKAQVLVGLLHRHFHPKGTDPTTSQLQLCADSIMRSVEAGFLYWSPDTENFVVRWSISTQSQEELDRFQYPLPFVVLPAEIKANSDTGYHTIGTKGSVVLNGSADERDLCLDHINRVNRTEYALNPDVISFVQNSWKGVDRQKDDETLEDFRKKQKAFEKYNRTSKEVIETLMMSGDRFWLTSRYDHRGRSYTQGYHVQPQGNAWNKACIQLAKKELVTS